MRSSDSGGGAGIDAQARLRTALAAALRSRDSTAVSALRSALSAIGNAEAVAAPAAAGQASAHIAGAAVGLGAGEAHRRKLSEAEVSRILQAEISERLTAARDYDSSGHPGRAQRLREEAHALTVVTTADVPRDHQAD
jgi:uncharacterized protein YqeY